MARTREKIKTFAGIRRAFRTWATGLGTTVAPEVSGATSAELHFLGALGGLAAEIGRGQLDRWPLFVGPGRLQRRPRLQRWLRKSGLSSALERTYWPLSITPVSRREAGGGWARYLRRSPWLTT